MIKEKSEILIPRNGKEKTRGTAMIEKLLREHFPPEYPPEAYRYNSPRRKLKILS